MSGFENAIINASNALIRAAMHSPNYVTGISGWTINKDGSAEFNNLTLRGTFQGNNWVMNKDGLFFYNGTAAAGNLSLAITNSTASGIDPYGNTYQPGGICLIALSGLGNVFSLVDTSGNALMTIDAAGNISANNANVDSLTVAGQDLFNDILPPFPLGIITRGWVPTAANWPGTAIGNTETAILELDYTVPANRQCKLETAPNTFIPTVAVNGQMIQQLRYTTDGSTPTTASGRPTIRSPGVIAVGTAQSGLNMPVPPMEWYMPVLSTAQLYRMLLTANITGAGNSFQYANASEALEMRVIDMGYGALSNSGVPIGSGTSGSSGRQTYTKTYYANASHSYYGDTGTYGTGHNSKRSDNSTMWQSCTSTPDHAFLEGDQYSFAMFNYSQINSDLAGATLNWAKLSLCNLTSYYSGGGNVICGYTTYTGAFGNTFVPGGGTSENKEVWHINKGATLAHILGAWFGPVITGATFTGFIFGPASSYTGYTDQNNYMSFYGYASPNPSVPQLILNYSK